jgi:dipeptidyl aminopeptidase/acylaminoacyl peptidase
MSLDDRGHRAGSALRNAVEDLRVDEPDRVSPTRFVQVQRRRRREQRIAAGIVATAIAILGVFLLARALPTGTDSLAGTPTGRILLGRQDPSAELEAWSTIAPDGSDEVHLGLRATCARWFPDGARILVTDDAGADPGTPLRPATVTSDGSGFRRLDAADDPLLNLGCGDVSPDGSRIVVEGFGAGGHDELDGIYTIRASDGGDVQRLIRGPVAPPRWSPDGSFVSYFDSREGVSPPGAGALFVAAADGSSPPRRITPWGAAFGDHGWSPDSEWIVFQRPYGQLWLVHPDGRDLHQIQVQLPAGSGALNPSWTPDGEWIVFSLRMPDRSAIAVVHPDGTDFRLLLDEPAGQLWHTDWTA